jgi:hypothetical protein
MKKNNLILALILIIIILVGFSIYSLAKVNKMNKNIDNTNAVNNEAKPNIQGNNSSNKNTVSFSGKLEKVNTGCFSDGECYVEIGGKHVTLIMGRSREVVGKIMAGDNSIGGLESLIGTNFQVYVAKIDEKNYTLYGDENYYIAAR